ncbi:DsbA family protein [Candidatus Uhrbacteria bacterium]|nr:DsbA family protein [Candidatus Uhrbacteria bacterium]
MNRWLPFIFIGFFTIIIFLFYSVFLSPVDLERLQKEQQQISLTEPTTTFVNPSRGANDAKITIIEFGDFECSACRDLMPALETVLKTYPNDVRLVWKDLPNDSAHKQAIPSAIAAHCADRQGGFWQYHDVLFQRQGYLSEDQYTQIASELKLDTGRFSTCIQNQDTLPIVQKDKEEGLALGLVATPTIFVNKEKFVGAVSVDELLQVIQQELSK